MAAKLRDEISKLEAESLAVSAKALAFENAEYAFRLGQKLRHKTFGTSSYVLLVIISIRFTFIYRGTYVDFFSFGLGYRAVVCGMDPICCESSSWMEAAEVEKLPRGSNQPFYQVLLLKQMFIKTCVERKRS